MEYAAPLPLTLTTDPELLTDWLERGREQSFHALVSRYAVLVRMAALRSGGGDEVLAAEAAQLTFILLARKARALSARKSLAGWLHLTAVLQVKNLVRQHRRESRKRLHLRASMENDPDFTTLPSPDHTTAWRELSPVLDKALAGLPDKYREPLLLRFYRSLSVAETAATLGIATAAAQKRLDRATAKLRARLIRLGCASPGGAFADNSPGGAQLQNVSPTAASLTAALFAGFAADSQAQAAGMISSATAASAGPTAGCASASLLAAKALAAHSASCAVTATTASGSGLSLLTKLAALKTSTFLPPALALLLAALWLTPKYRALAGLDVENRALDLQLAAARRKADMLTPPHRPQISGPAPVTEKAAELEILNWKELAAIFAEDPASSADTIENSVRRTKAELLIKSRIPLMSKAELADALDEVIAFRETMSIDSAGRLFTPLDLLITALIDEDPPFALSRFIRLAPGDARLMSTVSALAGALGSWAKTDPAAAIQWFDGQIAAGAFEPKALGGDNIARMLFESALMKEIFHSRPEEAERRLQNLSEGQRRNVLTSNASWMDESGRARFIHLSRELLSPENEAEVIARLAMHQQKLERRKAPQELNSYAGMEKIMDSLRVNSQERAACVRALASSEISGRIFRDGMKVQDLDACRSWIQAQVPAEGDSITGGMLGEILHQPKKQMTFGEVAALASRYDQESGGEEVLSAFLETGAADSQKDEARKIAATIRDQARRERVMKRLE